VNKIPDLIGQRFGKLVVISFHGLNKQNKSMWECICDCGKHKVIRGSLLRYGTSQSCGCLRTKSVTKHGLWGSPTYSSWHGMKQRCANPNRDVYKDYGGRGITMCERWNKFEKFLEDMGECPKGLTLDRIDNNGNYEPGNCRWVSMLEQTYNRRKNNTLTIDETKKLYHNFGIKGY